MYYIYLVVDIVLYLFGGGGGGYFITFKLWWILYNIVITDLAIFTVFLTIKLLIIAVPSLLFFFQDEPLQQVSYQLCTKQTVAFPDTKIIQVSSVGTEGTEELFKDRIEDTIFLYILNFNI